LASIWGLLHVSLLIWPLSLRSPNVSFSPEVCYCNAPSFPRGLSLRSMYHKILHSFPRGLSVASYASPNPSLCWLLFSVATTLNARVYPAINVRNVILCVSNPLFFLPVTNHTFNPNIKAGIAVI
jgi:hypothetical protein